MIWIFVVFAVLGSIGIVAPLTFAQEIIEPEIKPDVYDIGILLTNIGEIDTKSGAYELTFWVTISSDDVDFLKNPPPKEMDFTNGENINITGESISPHFYKSKINGIFYNDMNFQNYPFEKMNLVIHMEPFFPLASDKLVFTVHDEFSGKVDSNSLSVPGWILGEMSFDVTTSDSPWGSFSHIEADLPIGTSPLSAFLKKIFPIMILVGFAYATFWMSTRNTSDRIAILTGSLISAIFFHSIFLLGELPPLGYLTLADKIMMSAYGFFVITLIAILIHRHRLEISPDDYTITLGNNLDKKFRILAPIISIMIFLAVYQI